MDRLLLSVLVIISLIYGCSEQQGKSSDKPLGYRYPSFFPAMQIPEDNTPTEARIELGRRLFYEKKLSRNETISCGSCHTTSMAFTDGKTVSTGAHGKPVKRNSPALMNLAWAPHYMSEGGVKSLELQILGPVQDSIEMDLPLHEAAERLADIPLYSELSLTAYGRPIDAYVITRAIACFERSFISADSRFDRWYYLKQESEFNDSERRGKNIFFGEKAACMKCHSIPFFTDHEFYNIGLYENYSDPGRERVTYLPEDNGKFKTPSLRNIELTAPYMHDGRTGTLEDVIEFYNTGGKDHPNKDSRIRPMNWTDQEKKDLLAFLKTLTDWNFVQNQSFVPLEQ